MIITNLIKNDIKSFCNNDEVANRIMERANDIFNKTNKYQEALKYCKIDEKYHKELSDYCFYKIKQIEKPTPKENYNNKLQGHTIKSSYIIKIIDKLKNYGKNFKFKKEWK